MNVAAKTGLTAAVFALGLAACGTPGPTHDPYYSSSPSSYYYAAYGTVESVDIISDGRAGTTGAGAVLGGIAGGVLGHQIGSGRGQDAATIAGAIGGAVVGNEVERQRHGGVGRYRIAVRMDDGSYQTFVQDSADVRPGDRVRIDNGRVMRY